MNADRDADLERLLATERPIPEPSAARRARVARRLSERLGATELHSAGASAGKNALALSLPWATGLGALLFAAGIFVGMRMAPSEGPPARSNRPARSIPPARPDAPATSSPPATQNEAQKTRRAPSASAAAETHDQAVVGTGAATSHGESARNRAPRDSARRQRRNEPRGAPQRESAAGDLDAETRILDAARAALRAGDPASALRRLDAHAAEFPTGQLSRSRHRLRAQAERMLANGR